MSGCAIQATFPDTEVPQPQVALGSIKGSNYGGHAPIVGAHLFVLQAGTSGYGGAATSLLSATYDATSGYTTAQDTTSGSPTNGMYYVTTDHAGDFNITGDYSCTPGLPVYVYASGGTSALEPYTAITAGTVSGNTVTLTSNNLFSVGQYVTFGNFVSLPGTPLDIGTNSYAPSGVNNDTAGSYLVVAPTTLTSFTVQGTANFLIDGATGAGTAYPTLPSNPAIANMAVLGVCPSAGAANFSSLSYVYLNEVSTVAAAYALGGFFSNSATALSSTDAVHLSIPQENGNSPTSPAWVGIQNAANNAALLYSIQGNGPASTIADGEGHLANLTTPSGGTVPGALIDGIANALAGCVDSGNTATTATAPCTTLFADALAGTSASGLPTGTAPKDTATAAINLAHNPWTSKATVILNLAGTTVPYVPTVSSATDLAVAISYPISATVGSHGFNSVAIDAGGNAWVTVFDAGKLYKLSPVGAQLFSYTFPLDAANAQETPGQAALDSNGRAWVSIRNLNATAGAGLNCADKIGNCYFDGAYLFTNAGVLVAGSPFAATGEDYTVALGDDIQAAVDANDSVYFSNHAFNNSLLLNSAGSPLNSFGTPKGQTPTYTQGGPFGVVVDASNTLWMSSNVTTDSVTHWTGANNNVPVTIVPNTSIANPEGLAIDQAGSIWVANASGTNIYSVNPTTGATTQYSNGGLNDPVDVAVDGAGLVFATSPAGGANGLGSLSVVNGTKGSVLTGSSGINGSFVTAGNTMTPLNKPYFLAVDNSGNVWVCTNQSAVEYLGIATPVLTPLSAAVKKATIAVRP